MINFSTNSFNPLANFKVSVKSGENKSTNSNVNSKTNSASTATQSTNATTNSQNKFLVTDKSEAVSTSLGYGVDKDGYFTSDFNEAAGIPNDYKIHSSTMESLARIEENNKATRGCEVFKSIDIAQSIGNAYKILYI